jgi:DnaJ-class molecular chaperone
VIPGDCPNCDGAGWYVDIEVEADRYTGEPVQVQVQARCEQCRGTGEVIV